MLSVYYESVFKSKFTILIDWFQVFQKNGYFYIYDKKEKESKIQGYTHCSFFDHGICQLSSESSRNFSDCSIVLKSQGGKLPLLVLSWPTEYGTGHKKGVTFWGTLHFPCTPVVALHHIRLAWIKLCVDLIVIAIWFWSPYCSINAQG